MRRFPCPAAFTLVELLVVITIIVVLVALLAPAMDTAIYQAELAVCGSHLRVVAGAATVYAAEQRRYYPHRPQFSEPGAGWHTPLLYNGDDAVNAAIMYQAGAAPGKKFDDRILLREILALNATLNDPLTKTIDLEDFAPNAYGYSPYTRWFGWSYRFSGAALPGMIKLGDRFGWIDLTGERRQSDLLAQDHDITHDNNGDSQSAHPDKDGKTAPLVRQNQTFSVNGYPMTTTGSFWRGKNGQPRGPNDLNYAHADGSVRRRIDVKHRDEEMGFASYHSITNNAWKETLPLR